MNNHPDKIHHRAKAHRLMAAWAALVLAVCIFTVPALAAEAGNK